MRNAYSRLLAVSACAVAAYFGGAAQVCAAYPEKPITITVPFPAGGGVDVVGRLYAQQITESTGASIVVENRAGSGGIIGVGAIARSKADGYQFVMGSPGNISIAPSAYRSLSYDPAKDLQAVAMGVQMPILLVARPDAPFTTVAELISYSKQNPGKLTYGSGGTGTSLHLAGAMFAQMAGINALHVPYKGSTPALIDLMGGRVDYMFVDTSAMANVNAGKIKLLAVTSGKRSTLLPDTPTVAESGLPGYEAINWYGFFAPAGTPPEAVQWLHDKIQAALAEPALANKLKSQMVELPPAMDSAAFAQFVAGDTAKWSQLIKAMNLKLD
ncbi:MULTISPECIES: tripartite tricarboxylate transporter substrate binding protein [unclassified Achromobacter]|uniref:Bug family tripartite tricarboxylate transporter substrate binding protein n=1 Tax=unclassified Achromobacter TaxID=2626865 RepID=UPI002073CF41|nr:MULTISPECIES: tripartite tricarboxylate transporter substrate binding protein [unclassified Achromobacter]MDH1301207.1 tripartite tricarboxylate transporter substrate binding protein [Achromobacter sp. GD03932]